MKTFGKIFIGILTCVLVCSAIIINKDSIKRNPKNSINSLEQVFQSTEELITNSDIIIRGKISKTNDTISVPLETSNKKPMNSLRTNTEIKVNEVFKGNIKKGNTIVLNQVIGYESKGEKKLLDNIKPYNQDEEAILFLKKGAENSYYPINSLQDKIIINCKEPRISKKSIKSTEKEVLVKNQLNLRKKKWLISQCSKAKLLIK